MTHNFIESHTRSGDTILTDKDTHLRAIISPDSDPLNPRIDYDNAGSMVCWHRRYHLGDPGLAKEYPTADSFLRWWFDLSEDDDLPLSPKSELDDIPQQSGRGVLLPLYLYDHSGLTISHGSFSCQWDSGQVGYHYITRETILKEWGGKSKRLTKKMIEQAKKCLESELSEYDDYLRGNVYCITIEGPPTSFGEYHEDGDRETLESVCGFIGTSYTEEEAARMLTSAIAHHLEETSNAALRLQYATGAD